jgi:hypothetical protein
LLRAILLAAALEQRWESPRCCSATCRAARERRWQPWDSRHSRFSGRRSGIPSG